MTVPEFFAKRYHDESHILEGLAAVIIIIFFVPYTASGFRGCGVLFETLFGFPYIPAMIVSAIVILFYTTLGGFLAASTSDFFQSIIMSIALAIIMIFGIASAGGMGGVMEAVREMPDYLSLTSTFNVGTGETGSYGALTIVSTLAWGLGYFGMPHILLRFMAIEKEEKLTLSRRIASVWVVIAMTIAICIGFIGYGMTKAGAIELLDTSATSQTIIVRMAGVLSSHGIIPALLAGVIMAGILASTMSTADSQLLAAASSVTENILHHFLKKNLSGKTKMVLARLSVIVISVMAIFMAMDQNSSVFTIVSFAWAGFGAAFGPLMLFSLFWKRTTKWGALAGLLSGGVMVFVWKYLIAPLGGVFAIYELLPAFLVSAVCIFVVSLFTKEPSEEIQREFEEML
jgi:sodium/proline symporter